MGATGELGPVASEEGDAEDKRTWRRRLQMICKEILSTAGEGEVWALFEGSGAAQEIPVERLCSKEVRLCAKGGSRSSRRGRRRGAGASEL